MEIVTLQFQSANVIDNKTLSMKHIINTKGTEMITDKIEGHKTTQLLQVNY